MVEKEKQPAGQPAGTEDLFKQSRQTIQGTHTEELVIGLCGAIGSPIHAVADDLKTLLEQRYSYECRVIRLSALIEKYYGKAPASPRFDRITGLIDGGNALRAKYGYSVLADLAVHEIAKVREEYGERAEKQKDVKPYRRVCHIIDSIKNVEELRVLRLVYRDMFYSIGVFAPVGDRVQNFEGDGLDLAEIYKLIDRDSGEEIENGQSVRDTFPQSDFFLRAGREPADDRRKRLKRFMDLIFHVRVSTPTADETAMYQAASAAGNSACLSRQVGAAITDANGEILAIGWNDVPRKGGGLYVADPTGAAKDNRCLNWGEKCHNDFYKLKMAERIADAVCDSELLGKDKKADLIAAIRKPLSSLIEYSRSIHAEMHAIISASQSGGARVKDGRLYCTTYPCHNCARHIIAAGISEVYYIEPYRKSMAITLHGDAISEEESKTDCVRILPFDGVSPNKYLSLFEAKADWRKDSDGKLIKRNTHDVRPKVEATLESLPALEAIIVNRLADQHLIQTGTAK